MGRNTGGVAKNDQVDIALDHPLIGIETGKHPVWGNLVNILKWQPFLGHGFFHVLWRSVKVILEQISHRHQFDGGIGFDTIDDPRRNRATITATDQTDPNSLGATGSEHIFRSGHQRRETGRGSRTYKGPTTHRIFGGHSQVIAPCPLGRQSPDCRTV